MLNCLCFTATHNSIREKENAGDGGSLHISVGDGRPDQRDGCLFAEVKGAREGNAEQSHEPVHSHE